MASAIRDTITFPNTTVEAQLWGGQGVIDGAGMWFGSKTVELTQVVGYLEDEANPLTLNFTFNWVDGFASFSITTLSD